MNAAAVKGRPTAFYKRRLCRLKYFAVKAGEGWRVAGGKYFERQVQIHGEAAHTVADAINAIYSGMGVERKVEVKTRKGKPYIKLTNVDLELLGLVRHE